MLRIKQVQPLGGYRLRLTLTDGSIVERDVGRLLTGPVFESIRDRPDVFRRVEVRHGTLSWPGDVDLCPDVVLTNLPSPEDVRVNSETT